MINEKDKETILNKEEFIRLRACEIITQYYSLKFSGNQTPMQFEDIKKRIKEVASYIENGYF